jgi:hypothetical protein
MHCHLAALQGYRLQAGLQPMTSEVVPRGLATALLSARSTKGEIIMGRRRLFSVVLAAGLITGLMPLAFAGANTPAPPGLPSFYSVPSKWPSKAPGTLIKDTPVAVNGLNGTAYRVMYVSQANKAKPVAVTGYLVVPTGTAPKGGWPVVAWDHGTNGMADLCAPSLNIGTSDIPLQIINAFLAKGWAFTASDYQGEGTPGLLPYIVGASAAEDTINIVRADLGIAGADTSATWVDWGHSEGGQTAMFVDHLATGYAPDLHLLGVVAGAPPSQFTLLNTFLKTSPYAFYILMVAFGFNAYYGNKAAPLSKVVTAKALSLLPLIAKVKSANDCTGALQAAVAAYVKSNDFGALQKADPTTIPAWKKLILANDPQSFSSSSPVPMVIIQGGNDEQIPVVSTQILYTHLCSLGQVLQRWIYPGQSHAGVITPSFNDMIQWISDRFAGGANPDPYVPTGQTGIVPTTQVCN